MSFKPMPHFSFLKCFPLNIFTDICMAQRRLLYQTMDEVVAWTYNKV